MEFYAFESFTGENFYLKSVWESLRKAFQNDEAILYFRYPIFKSRGKKNREPEFLIVHKELGTIILLSRRYGVSNIKNISKDDWTMSEWENESEQPCFEAENQMFGLKSILDENPISRNVIQNYTYALVLTEISSDEWIQNVAKRFPQVNLPIIFSNNLSSQKIKSQIESILANNSNQQNIISNSKWIDVTSILRGSLTKEPPRTIPTGIDPDNPIRIIHFIESSTRVLDRRQQQIAYQVPDGPQRLRGLAGTGKTVLLTKRVAKMHAAHPDWNLCYVFFTRSLYGSINSLIRDYYMEMTGKEPNWKNISVLHGWGGVTLEGFYHLVASKLNQPSYTLDDVKRIVGDKASPGEHFRFICNRLLNSGSNFPELFDSIIIDEGQDLPSEFYKIVYKVLKQPKRLYWAYDEAQGIGSLVIPTSESMFGLNSNGEPLVDVARSYEGGILKSHRMTLCYRTPRMLLMIAHALNMGLFREGGAIQGVTTQEDWNALGYEVIEGDFRKVGEKVTITRQDDQSPHSIDQPDFRFASSVGSLIMINSFNSEEEEKNWIVEQVNKDLELGFKPDDILITSISGDNEKEYYKSLKDKLENKFIKSFIAGIDKKSEIFRIPGCVTISNLFRAKGNEAWKVYVARFHYSTEPLSWKNENELMKRNEAFVAITRSRIWCILTGMKNYPIFEELDEAIEQYPNFSFPAFNKASLQRAMDSDEVHDEEGIEIPITTTPVSTSVKIKENETGYSYQSLFLPYLKDSKDIIVNDPYIRLPHQIKNLIAFCHMLIPNDGLLNIHLTTGFDNDLNKNDLEKVFSDLQQSLVKNRIKFTYEFDEKIHDRSIVANNGWKIIPGRGLDMFQKPETKYGLEEVDQSKRKCKQTEIVYLKLNSNKLE
jgi:superfamily I DNA and RNA helicase